MKALRSIYPANSTHRIELEEVILTHSTPTGSGYVVDSLHSARLACQSSSYQDVIQAAIALGNDTDTTACIAGIRHGKNSIPSHWIQQLRGKEILIPLLEQISCCGHQGRPDPTPV